MVALAVKQELIAALRKGRKKRPKQHAGAMTSGPNAACALGAIAIGFDLDPSYYVLKRKFVELGLPTYAYLEIYKRNDRAMNVRSDPDMAVIQYIKEEL